MKKLLIASAVSAALAAPTVALAQAAKAPTLGQVLDASGINVNGYIDAQYNYANRNVETGFSDRAFDSQNNSFGMHQFGLTVAKQPRQGFGGVVNLTIGTDAQFIHSFPEGTSTNAFDITQAYGQYASGSLTLMAGKFTTLAGTEVIASTGNTNISRSILFTAVPLTHTGVRAGYAIADWVTVYGGLNNGWDQMTDINRAKTLEAGASFIPIKPLTINVSGYFGKESATAPGAPQVAGPQGQRSLFDVTVNYVFNDSMSAGAEGLYVSQADTAAGTAKVAGLAGYFAYLFNSQWRASARSELFDDKNNFRFASASVTPGTGVKYTELTVTLAYLPNASAELRAEVRGDKANHEVFIDSNGTTSKTLLTFGLQGIYKF